MPAQRIYMAIDLKSFYASVECMERGLDPLTTRLVVADPDRTSKTICLAVSPALKQYGIPGRARLFEVEQAIKRIKATDPALPTDYIIAKPQMKHYMDVSTSIYRVYLKYIAPEDIHVYSIDEVFMDVTDYLHIYRKTPEDLARMMILDVLKETGITATAGIGTNLYLAKVAMDIVAKHIPPDENGVRIARLDEGTYREMLWSHTPLTDFWRVGRGTAAKLAKQQIFTMGDIVRCSLGGSRDYYNEDLLYKMFGINAELLIDHAWGVEPCTMADIKSCRPESSSIGSGQVLQQPYEAAEARLVTREMTDLLSLQLVEKALVTDQLILTVGYDIENLNDPVRAKNYRGEITRDFYGRQVPKSAHGSIRLSGCTNAATRLVKGAMELYDRIVDQNLLVRRINITAGEVLPEEKEFEEPAYEQLDLFTDYEARDRKKEQDRQEALREKKMQQAVLELKKKFGKNAVLKGMNLEKGATARMRNDQIGGHKA